MRAPEPKRPRRAAVLSARLRAQVTLDAQPNGEIFAFIEGYSLSLGTFSPDAAEHAKALRKGVPLATLTCDAGPEAKELELLVRRLARRGLVEYRLGHSRKRAEKVIIEPQLPEYWPNIPQLGKADRLVLSRFAYMRRRGSDLVLESPRSGALFKISDPQIASFITLLSEPQQIKELRRHDGFPGLEVLALLFDGEILFKVAAGEAGLRRDEGDDSLVLWDFHDLLFHARSMPGRHANPLGGLYAHAGVIPPLPAVRPSWPGERIDLGKVGEPEAISPVAKLLRQRHSTRSFDDERPITLPELSRFLDGAARVLSTSHAAAEIDDGGHTVRPYPCAGAAYELELYVSAERCEGLARGLYHYDAAAHALVPIGGVTNEFEALLSGAGYAMGAAAPPQILITIAARFGRISWKYSAIAYSLILRDAGVLMQTLYLMATDLNLGGCAIGIADITLFAKLTGLEFHVEGPVGQFALGSSRTTQADK